MYKTHFKNSVINTYMSLYCLHTLQRKQTQSFCFTDCKSFCFTDRYQMEVMLFFSPRSPFRFVKQGHEFKTVVGGILLPLDSITMLCKHHTVLRDSLTPTILNVVIISATELGPPAQFKFLVVSLSKIPSKILQLHEILQAFQILLKTVRPG